MHAGEETAAPEFGIDGLATGATGAVRNEHGERWKIAILCAEPVAHPRTHAGPTGLLVAGLKEGDARIVIDRLSVHRLDEAQVVRDSRSVREQFA